jgi:hypothetical protein
MVLTAGAGGEDPDFMRARRCSTSRMTCCFVCGWLCSHMLDPPQCLHWLLRQLCSPIVQVDERHKCAHRVRNREEITLEYRDQLSSPKR